MSSFETEIKCADRDAALAMALQYEQEWYWHQSTISETDRGIVLSYRVKLYFRLKNNRQGCCLLLVAP